MPYQPDLPIPAHADVDSMLSRKFGREIANYFSSPPLNRVSFLRTDHPFLNTAVYHPTTRFLLFNDLAPLVKTPSEIVYASFNDVEPLIGKDPYGKSEEDMIKEYNSSLTVAQLVFLGLDESKKDGLSYNIYTGAPRFALDVTPKGSLEEKAKNICKEMESKGLHFMQGRHHLSLPAPEAAMYAQSRAMLDWNARNPFCGTCGQPTLSANGGAKRVCPPTDFSSLPQGTIGSTTASPPLETARSRPPCSTRTTLSNLTFPRTDPTIIVAVLSQDSQRILLGRQKRWPPHWYSTLAGFIEPAESVEDAVRREVWEESGVALGRVIIHSTQPWPYPANLMIGAIAQVASMETEEISLQHDPELDDARWFDIADVEEALRVGTSGLGDPAPEGYTEGNLRLPPKTAIANQLITAVVEGNFLGGVKEKM